MRKILLVFGALFLTLSVGAQSLNKSISIDSEARLESLAKSVDALKPFTPQMSLFSDVTRAASSDTVAIIDCGRDWGRDTEKTPFYACSSYNIAFTGNTQSYKDATYNVATIDFGGAEWKALVAQDGSSIVIPTGQEYAKGSAVTYGCTFVLKGMVSGSSQLTLDTENDIVYTRSTGNTSLYNCGCVGWCISMKGGTYDGGLWSASYYSTLCLPNAIESGYKTKNGSWVTYANPIYVEEGPEEITVINFNGSSVLNMTVSNDTITIPMGQIITSTSSSLQPDYGYFFKLIGCGSEGTGIYRDATIPSIKAYFSEPTYNSEGKITGYVTSNRNIMTPRTSEGYMIISSDLNSEDKYYQMGYRFALSFTLTSGKYQNCSVTAGIKSAIEESRSKNGKFLIDNKMFIVKDGKTYTLDGHLVR